MIHRNICPICGSENPEGSEFCQVCKANLQTLPSEMFPTDNTPAETEKPAETEAKTIQNEELDLDSPIPNWMKTKLISSDKKPMDFDVYTDMLFGMSDSHRSASPNKALRSPRTKKPDPVYQPMFQSMVEPPLIEPDENAPKTLEENIPGIADFSIQRPARKWEDRKPEVVAASYKGTSISLLDDFNTERPARKWDDQQPGSITDTEISHEEKTSQGIKQLPLWWQQDAPLVEDDENTQSVKGAEDDDPALANSVSPTKVENADEIFGPITTADRQTTDEVLSPSPHYDEYKPENGSLISDLMNDINSSSGSLTPSEQEENLSGTVFYSGNHPGKDDIPEPDYSEITVPEDSTGANAEMLDRILRNIGYEVEGTALSTAETTDKASSDDSIPSDGTESSKGKEEKTEAADTSLKPIHGFYIPEVIDNPLIPDDDDDEESEGKDADPYDLENAYGQDKEDFADDQDIPWDLFGSADMALPQSPEDPAFRTFSRSSIPEDPGSTTYQQRMISSILGKIIQAENFVEPPIEKNNRKISLAARIFWAALAICGIVLLLVTDIADNLNLPFIPSADETQAFYQYAESVSGNALIVMDYTPAYSAEMNTAALDLIQTLTGHAGRVYLAALNPAAMPETIQILNQYGESVEFAGWWPSGVISIRSKLSSGNIPEEVWLLTSETTSVRNWAEQISVSGEPRKLHVMGPGQLEPLLKPYLQSEMITSFLSRDFDLNNYGEYEYLAGRSQAAVWYLCMLIPLAWLGGVISKFMKSEPGYSKRIAASSEKNQQFSEIEPKKETAND